MVQRDDGVVKCRLPRLDMQKIYAPTWTNPVDEIPELPPDFDAFDASKPHDSDVRCTNDTCETVYSLKICLYRGS